MTNGQLTKQILRAAKNMTTPDALYAQVSQIMRRFPISSNYLVYDYDCSRFDTSVWAVVWQAAVDTDKAKFDRLCADMKTIGCKQPEEFGRYNPHKPLKLSGNIVSGDQ